MLTSPFRICPLAVRVRMAPIVTEVAGPVETARVNANDRESDAVTTFGTRLASALAITPAWKVSCWLCGVVQAGKFAWMPMPSRPARATTGGRTANWSCPLAAK